MTVSQLWYHQPSNGCPIPGGKNYGWRLAIDPTRSRENMFYWLCNICLYNQCNKVWELGKVSAPLKNVSFGWSWWFPLIGIYVCMFAHVYVRTYPLNSNLKVSLDLVGLCFQDQKPAQIQFLYANKYSFLLFSQSNP